MEKKAKKPEKLEENQAPSNSEGTKEIVFKIEYVEKTGPDYFYALEKLGQAVYNLTTGKGPIKERIIDAYLALSPLQERDFPTELQNDFKWVKSELTKKAAKMRTVIIYGHVTQESTGYLERLCLICALTRLLLWQKEFAI